MKKIPTLFFMVLLILTYGTCIAQQSSDWTSPYEVDQYTVALWHFGELSGNNVADASPNGYNGTTSNTLIVSGLSGFGNAREFIYNPPNWENIVFGNFNLPQYEGTIEFWIKPSPPPANATHTHFFVKALHGSSSGGFTFYISIFNDGLIKVGLGATGGDLARYFYNSIVFNEWQHVGFVWTTIATKLYVNGELIGVEAPFPTGIGQTNQEVAMGKWGSTIYSTNSFVGIIDEFRISNVARLFQAAPPEPSDLTIVPEELSNLPVDMHFFYPSFSTLNNSIYLFGGRNPGDHIVQAHDWIWKYSITNNSWEELTTTLPYEVGFNVTAAYFNGHFYMGPGFATGTSNGWGINNKIIDVNLISGTSDEINAFPFNKIWGMSSIEVEGKIYFFGGHNGADQTAIFMYDPTSSLLTKVADMINPKPNVTLVLSNNGWIYYFVGDSYSRSKRFERFNPQTGNVELLNVALPYTGRSYVNNTWYIPSDNTIYFFQSQIEDPIIYKYDINNDEIINTGVNIPGNFVFEPSVMDKNDLFSIYAFKLNTAPSSNHPLILTKLTLDFGTEPDILVDPIAYDYGNIEVGSISVTSIIVENEGDANLDVSSALLSGLNSSEFTIVSGSAPFTVPAGDSHNIEVVFEPITAPIATKTAMLTIESNDPDENFVEVTLEGNGIPFLHSSYIFLAEENIEIERRTTSTIGDMHSNDKIKFKKGDPSTHTGNLTSVGKIEIKKNNTIVGDAESGETIEVEDNSVITGIVTEYSHVTVILLPILSFAAGGDNITVAHNQSFALEPGSYNKVKVKKNAQLYLSTGDYYFEELKLEKEAFLSVDIEEGPVEINVVKKMEFMEKTEVDITPLGDEGSRYLTFNYLDHHDLKFKKESKILGSIIAPDALVDLKKEVTLIGSISAHKIKTDKDVEFNFHSLTSNLEKGNNTKEEQFEYTKNYSLSQNYPNPFNPSTKIVYQIPQSGNISIRVYDILGKEVTTLVNGFKLKGTYEIDFDASELSSGLYIYQLRANNHIETKKMILLR